eukprot:TRINITY_DN2325_c1_g1_i1.p1 TRINITY_DN2325_c1_g1~~TRINITY_DN2325_c1_g1_i1.p1  ORF type:complete len:442 (+),score=71.88 TRINITY_DN2325_c1_g1_i1:119-1327(+)
MTPPPISLHHDLAKLLGKRPAYGLAVVDKINTKGRKDKRYLLVTASFLFLVTHEGRVRRMWELEELGDIHIKGNQMLFRVKGQTEPDQLLEYKDGNSKNGPSGGMEAFIDVIKNLYKARPPHSELPIVRAEHSLKSVARLQGKKVDPVSKRNKLSATMQSKRASAPPGGHTALVGDAFGKGGYDSDGAHGSFHSGSPRARSGSSPNFRADEPIAGGISGPHSPRTPVSPHSDGPHTRWVPGSWKPRSSPGAHTPPDTLLTPSVWEQHISKTTSGRPYWYNRVTGENTWTQPKELQNTSPVRTRNPKGRNRGTLPWVPAPAASPKNKLTVPDELYAEMQMGPATPLSTISSPLFPHPPASDAVLQHAAACSGTDLNVLVDAANDVNRRRGMSYNGNAFETIVV